MEDCAMGQKRKREVKKAEVKVSKKGGEADGLMSMEEAIRLLGTSRPTFYRWLRTGRLKGLKFGGHWRFERGEIERFKAGVEPHINLRADPEPLIERMRLELRRRGCERLIEADLHGIEGLCRMMFLLAAGLRASELHLALCQTDRPDNGRSFLRYRVDGQLLSVLDVDNRLLPAIVEQWKVLAGCDRHDTVRPQEGQWQSKAGDEEVLVDFVALPTPFGESMGATFLFKSVQESLRLAKLGFSADVRERIERNLRSPWGIVLCAGSNGSGKTSTLYAAVNETTSEHRLTVAIEEKGGPRLPWVLHTLANPDKGVTVPMALRAALRLNPDAVMVGEMRERESWRLSEDAAFSGRLVLTQMEAPDAVGALLQLRRLMGDAFRRDTPLKLIVAQRLLRKLCPACSQPSQSSDASAVRLRMAAERFGIQVSASDSESGMRVPCGCATCGQLGFRGRIMVAEVLELSPQLLEALCSGATEATIRELAIGQATVPMAVEAISLAREGKVSADEVLSLFAVP
jgi:excisionase family DNA binding protein